MKIRLKRADLAVLIFHLTIMRKNIKKGFKANYGLIEAKRKMAIYDELKNILSNDYEGIEQEEIFIMLNGEKLDMLHSFINWYVTEIEVLAEIENVDIGEQEDYLSLKKIRGKINQLYHIS